MRLVGFIAILFSIPTGAQPFFRQGNATSLAEVLFLTDAEEPVGRYLLQGGGGPGSAFSVPNRQTLDRTLARVWETMSPLRSIEDLPATPTGPAPRAEFETWAEQLKASGYSQAITSGFTAIEKYPGRAVARRFVRNANWNVCVRYSLTFEAIPDSSNYRLTVNDSADELIYLRKCKVVSLANYPAPQVLEDGDILRIELYAEGSTGPKLVDYIHFGYKFATLKASATRDAFAQDAPFSLATPSLRINGVPVALASPPASLETPAPWLYVPGQGRFVLSFGPHPEVGFKSAGQASGNELMFTADSTVVRIKSGDRIASGSGSYIVYVLHDPAWEPSSRSDAMLGSAASVNDLLKR
jgi:hypothetical protein